MAKWIENFLLPCPFKALTGLDCPGCGFQRSVLALFKGDFTGSFQLYPATIPILLLAVFLLVGIKLPLPQREKIRKALFGIAALTVIVSYAFKIQHYF
ncbi:MAG: DUF2752 domain-containing protein [Janthinobacterium lividum]